MCKDYLYNPILEIIMNNWGESRLKVKHSNPEGLFDSRVFSQVVTVSGNAKTIYIGGQNAINSEGQLIGRDNLELQTKQVLEVSAKYPTPSNHFDVL